MFRLGGALILSTLVLSGCILAGNNESPPPEPGPGPKVAAPADESYSLALPQGWKSVEAEQIPDNVVGIQSATDEHSQILAAGHDSAKGAEKAAIYQVTGIMSSEGIACQRMEHFDGFGGPMLIFDCPWTEPEPFHKVYIPVVEGDRSVLLLVQADGADLEADIGPVARQAVEGLKFR